MDNFLICFQVLFHFLLAKVFSIKFFCCGLSFLKFYSFLDVIERKCSLSMFFQKIGISLQFSWNAEKNINLVFFMNVNNWTFFQFFGYNFFSLPQFSRIKSCKFSSESYLLQLIVLWPTHWGKANFQISFEFPCYWNSFSVKKNGSILRPMPQSETFYF